MSLLLVLSQSLHSRVLLVVAILSIVTIVVSLLLIFHKTIVSLLVEPLVSLSLEILPTQYKQIVTETSVI